ncbi:D-proline reductase subunit gamma [Defluviimonas aquaemixtae]|uniref:D-proline reductase subunit gamma n=1 Tax=Albidovulum aquaemixtae TaxID=1542388 RepID=A0A2R8B3T7_9RHOB|nr:glycine reductase [Defluviimonas aquaemixtae]SPH17190.1 D-proline reductase subunit gamma [Defluviimonas aquaemixtae]
MARASDDPIRYIDRTRDYYLALGYGAPYRWARLEEVPFAPLPRPLFDATVAIITTAAAYNAAAKFYEAYAGPTASMPDLHISHVAIDRDHTTAEDIGTYFPLAALARAAAAGRIGRVGPRFYGLPTNRSQSTTMDVDCPALVAMCRADGVDATLLVPNCPVCHQSVALAARALEEAGIAAVVMGCALDIVERVGVARFLFSDFPLGNSAGRPHDVASQDETLGLALDLLDGARGPCTTVRSPLRWTGDPAWKASYCNAARLTPEDIIARRAAFDAGKAVAAAKRAARTD